MGKMPMLREVRGDLDWIVMKSLEKDRSRRYETASGLAEDIRRHLEHEPVVARSPSPIYRLGKFLRRHQVQILVSLTLAALIAAVAVTLSIWHQDRLQWNRDRLQLTEAERLQHEDLLDRARDQYARAERDAALQTIEPILDSPHVGGQAQLLRAGILVDNRRFQEATTILGSLLQELPAIAGAAHALLARVLWESQSPKAEKSQEIEMHRRQAETLLPETAEAYFLRAMTAPTIKEQLAALDKALELDPDHYESLRLRAFTYYASRRYASMRDDALGMAYLRRRDPLGYSLRAIALCELGEYGQAIAEYEKAMALTGKEDPQYLDLALQRSETRLRLGDYERVIADAPEALKHGPDRPVFRYHSFAALTALGRYDQAAAVFQEVVCSTPTARNALWSWAAKYVFDTLAAGRAWHPLDRAPTGAAFLPLAEAEETYRKLSAKGHRLTRDGFSAQWSPDGKKLAFSLGVQARSGVALYDPATQDTELLIVPGKYPKWSPDGRYLAFVRDRQFLRVPEFVAANPLSQPPVRTDEEIWLMKADGTEPRRLARGVWPSWSQDSTCVYYRSPLDSTLYSISIAGEDAEPQRIMACPGSLPSVSPGNQHVAYIEDASLEVTQLSSQTLVAQWPLPTPSGGWSASAWSPDGNALCLGGSGGLENRTGLWIYRLDQNEPAQTLGGPITVGSWAPDGTKFVFELGGPHFEIWTVDLASNLSTSEALGPARTVEEHLRDLVALHTRRIKVNPLDAYAYSDRARCYDCLHDQARANADMRRWSTAATGELPCDFRRVINIPFACELVFSAERPATGVSLLSVAFGQKGRWEMRLFEIPVVVTSLLGFCLLSGLETPAAQADFAVGKAVDLGPPVNGGAGTECVPCISADGRELYFQREEPLGEIYVARRPTPDSMWGEPVKLGPTINTSDYEGGACISADGLSLYFCRASGGMFVTRRATTKDDWGTPVNLGPVVNNGLTFGASVSADELELYFHSDRAGGYGNLDIWVTTRPTVNDNWGTPVNLGPTVNTPSADNWPGISSDGLALFFSSTRPGGSGSYDLHVARRATRQAPWGQPVNLGPLANSAAADVNPKVSFDGSTLYFCLYPRGIWQVPIVPAMDFNGDGKVDAKDMGLLTDNWGKNTSLCDIGPFAWGDGIVDEKDLGVLMESLVAPGPKASDVPCDVTLSWVSPSFANTCDVYLGTSQEAVTTASRTNPQGVLASQGQTATTYAPAKPLEFSKTYYWRVDFVITGPTPIIVKGPVFKFTTAALTYPIKKITAKASSASPGSGPERTVDRSGLDKTDGHSTDVKDMWWSMAEPSHWIQYEFDRVYTLHEMWVWNMNQIIEPFVGFGAKTVKIEYSTDGTAWAPLANVPEFAKASGKAGYTANTIVSFAAIPAKFVKLTIEKNWGVAPQTGLSEVRFFAIQSTAVPKP